MSACWCNMLNASQVHQYNSRHAVSLLKALGGRALRGEGPIYYLEATDTLVGKDGEFALCSSLG